MNTPKLIVILGPTASGKSSLAIKLAKKFNGEIISADSRQVYKGLDVGSGKVTKTEQKAVRHHLLDIVSPKKQYTVAHFKRDIKRAIAQIMSKGKIPFLVGGTAFYIYAAIDDWQIPEVKPNPKLRKTLSKKSTSELFRILKMLDPKRARTIDRHNPVRLIRAIEMVKATGLPVPSLRKQGSYKSKIPDQVRDGMLVLGLNPPDLKQRISKNVEQRFNRGLIKEVKKLLKSGVSAKRLKQIGLTYALVTNVLPNGRPTRRTRFGEAGGSAKTQYYELKQKIKTAEWRFAKRQMIWFKRDQRIYWVRNQKQTEILIKQFLNK